MKTSILFTLAITSLIHFQFFGQDTQNEPIEKQLLWCDSDSLSIHLPAGHISSDTMNYMEGFIKTFWYADGSSISLLCGANATLSLNDKSAKGRFSRKSRIKGHEITCEGVSSTMKPAFDRAFDMMERRNIIAQPASD